MTGQQPPWVATWLAQRLVSGPRRESLLGDLIEQYRQGRSGIWYWRQVLAAILVGTVHDLAAHKTLALRTLMIGWTLYYLFAFPVTWAGGIAEDWLSQRVILCAPGSFWCQFWRNQFSVELLIYVAAAEFSEAELGQLLLAVVAINAWNRVAIATHMVPEL